VSALRGSLTYARFFVEGEVPDDAHDRFLKAIRKNVLQPLVPEEDAPERTGWCRMAEPFELDLSYEDVFWNEYLNLGVRTDRWAIPGPMLKAKVREAEAELLKQKGRDRLTKHEKKELKDMTAKQLRRQIAPSTRAVDLSWSLNEGVVRFFSQSDKRAAFMIDLFEKTFKVKLVAESPYTLAARLGLTKAQELAWQEAEPSELAVGDAR
jgi:DNA recombination-dependent growth factor C